MRALDRKMMRDLWNIKGQAFAIVMVIASGVGTFVMSLSTLHSLSQSQQSYYERYRFAEVFAQLEASPAVTGPQDCRNPGGGPGPDARRRRRDDRRARHVGAGDRPSDLHPRAPRAASSTICICAAAAGLNRTATARCW